MMEKEALSNIRTLWELVQKDRTFAPEIAAEIECLLIGTMQELESIKGLGTKLYREVGRSNYPDSDPRRDGIRSLSHFIMAYWDLRSGREDSARHRLMVARGNMSRYFEAAVYPSMPATSKSWLRPLIDFWRKITS